MRVGETTSRVAQQLQDELRVLPVGERVPSEQALADRFHVGRGVIHGILTGFERRGFVRRDRGAGTRWLGFGEFADASGSLPSFRATVRANGHEAGFRGVDVRPRRAVKGECDLLEIPANSLVWKVQRVFTINDVPVGFATSVLPFRAFPALPSELDSYGSIYETLRRRYGLTVRRAWKQQRAVNPPAFVGEALLLENPVPFRFVESLNRDTDGSSVEYARSFMRNDRYVVDALGV